MQKVNWGIIGLGSVAKEFIDGFKKSSNAILTGLASKDINKINYYKKNHQLKVRYYFDDYEKIIEEKNVDIIYLALPTFLHKKWTINCLNKKKFVLVEKPSMMNFSEITEVDKHPNSNKFFFEAFMYLFHPQIKKVFELIRDEEIGELVSMESYFGNNILTKKNFFGFIKKKKINPKRRIFNKEMGGGCILDLGCYPVSFAVQLASIKNAVNYKNIKYTNKIIKLGTTGVEIDSFLNIEFDNDFSCKIGASFSQNIGKGTVIVGTRGKIIIEDTWTANPSKIILRKKDKDKIFNFQLKKNIYAYEIEAISEQILDQSKINKQCIKIDQSKIFLNILDSWKN